jgi:hypothetical protein
MREGKMSRVEGTIKIQTLHHVYLLKTKQTRILWQCVIRPKGWTSFSARDRSCSILKHLVVQILELTAKSNGVTLNIVHCSLYIVHFSLHIVHLTLQIVHCCVYILQDLRVFICKGRLCVCKRILYRCRSAESGLDALNVRL